jgi:hypothetical protein
MGVGYVSMRNTTFDGALGGYFLSVEGSTQAGLGVVGEFSGTWTQQEPRYFGDPEAGTGAFLTGPKLSLHRFTGVTPFAQVLAGIGSSGHSRSVSYTAFGVESGGGFDLKVRQHVGVRIGAGYRLLLGIHDAAGAKASFRVVRVGLVFQ